VSRGKVAPNLSDYARLNWASGPHLFAGDAEHARDLLREFRALLAVARAAHRLLHSGKHYRMNYRIWSALVDADARLARASGRRGTR
jgi:hypothetical protein